MHPVNLLRLEIEEDDSVAIHIYKFSVRFATMAIFSLKNLPNVNLLFTTCMYLYIVFVAMVRAMTD